MKNFVSGRPGEKYHNTRNASFYLRRGPKEEAANRTLLQHQGRYRLHCIYIRHVWNVIHLFSVHASRRDSLLGFRVSTLCSFVEMKLFITKVFRLDFPTLVDSIESQRVQKLNEWKIETPAIIRGRGCSLLQQRIEQSLSTIGSHFPSTFPLKTGSEIIPAIIRGAGAVLERPRVVYIFGVGRTRRTTKERKRRGGGSETEDTVWAWERKQHPSNANSNKGLVSAVRWGHYTLYCAWRGRYTRLVRTKFRAQCERCVSGDKKVPWAMSKHTHTHGEPREDKTRAVPILTSCAGN